MEVTKSYDWEGNLSGYQWDNMSVPLAEGNRHYHEIKNAITNGTYIVNEPAIKEVTAAYNQKGNLSGYRWNHIFVSIPIDESKPFHRMVKRAIEDGSCVIKEPDPIKTEGPLLETIIFCVFFDQPWPLEGPYQGIIPYQSHAEAESRAYTFRLINLSSVGKLNGLDLLFDYHSGALPEQFLIHYPLQSSVLELEVPVSYLQKLFFNERSQLEEHENNFINMIVIPHLRESGRKRPTTKFLISLSVYYLRNFIMDVGNRIL